MAGMKEGIGDDPFDDESESESGEAQQSMASEDTDTVSQTGRNNSTSSQRSLPYIHSRDYVKEKRQQRPVFLREQTEDGISDLVDAVEDDLGEEIYQTDVLEAAMEVAIENPKLVAEKCRDYGYDWE
ncbi:hypothetical protein [Halovenus sp. HT40]|uniref:hypothetical protein n=1 Tax=Halovenus sp. HT40 TaxID=3126691 RepID=UPI00300E8DF5